MSRPDTNIVCSGGRAATISPHVADIMFDASKVIQSLIITVKKVGYKMVFPVAY